MTSAERYVTAAYLVVLGVRLAYLVIYACKRSRLDNSTPRGGMPLLGWRQSGPRMT